MTEVISSIISEYNFIISSLPPFAGNFINLFLLVVLILVYSVFIWKLHKFISKKNIFELNLKQYNKSEHPFLKGLFYFLEYIIILPFLIFFWFGILTLFLILLTEGIAVKSILIISAIVIASIRMTAYYSEELSKELAKLLPFNLLAIALLSSNFMNIEGVLNQFNQIPAFFNEILIYLLFIIILEIILRFFDFILSLFGLEEVEKD